MPTQLISVGVPTTLVQNQVYALPTQLCLVTTSAACDVSMDGTTWAAFTSGNPSGSVFIRSAGVGTIITCK